MFDIDVDRVPYVIARPLHEVTKAGLDDALAVENLLATYSALLRFIALLALGQFLGSDYLEPSGGRVAAAGKAVAALRQPTLQSWYTAAQTLSKLFGVLPQANPGTMCGPFCPQLIKSMAALTKERVNGRPLHDAITSFRNDFFGHSEGATAASKRQLRDAVEPLVLRALKIFEPAFLSLTLLRRAEENTMIRLSGPGPHFATESISDDEERRAFERSDALVEINNRCFEMFPLMIAAPKEVASYGPIFSFDGYRVLDLDPSGQKVRTEYLKFRNFGGWIYRADEYKTYKELLDRKGVSPLYDSRTFEPWSVADWAASETRLTLASLTNFRYFPAFYRERPLVEERVWSWLDRSSLPALLILAEAGMGKTSLFCHLAWKLVQPREERLDGMESADDCVVLLLGSEVRSGLNPLFEKLCRTMGVAPFSAQHLDGFRDFRQLLDHWERNKRRDFHASSRRLVILLDAANEARSLQEVLEEFSAWAKVANEANIITGHAWVKLLVSARSVHFRALERKLGANSDTPLGSIAKFGCAEI